MAVDDGCARCLGNPGLAVDVDGESPFRRFVLDVVEGPGQHDAPLVDDGNVLAYILNQIELMAREHDRHAFGGQPAQGPGKGFDADGIELGRVVETAEKPRLGRLLLVIADGSAM